MAFLAKPLLRYWKKKKMGYSNLLGFYFFKGERERKFLLRAEEL